MGLFSKGRRKRQDLAADPDARTSQLGLKNKDMAVLGQLMAHGADLKEPRHVLHFSYFPNRGAAEAAAAELSEHGWQTQVGEPLPQFPGQWSVRSEQHDVVLAPDFVRESTDLFEQVAERHSGEYDGWEASVGLSPVRARIATYRASEMAA